MSIHVEQVRSALRRHASSLQVFHDDIARALLKDNLVNEGKVGEVHATSANDSTLIDKVSAAMKDPGKAPAARFALGTMKRLNIPLDACARPTALSDAMKAKGVDPETRVAIKSALHKIGILD